VSAWLRSPLRCSSRLSASQHDPGDGAQSPFFVTAGTIATLAGQQGPGLSAADLAEVMPGVDQAQALRHTAALMDVSGGISAGPGWLEVVLSWPRRFVAFPAVSPRQAMLLTGCPGDDSIGWDEQASLARQAGGQRWRSREPGFPAGPPG
jgi:hypothetical protein